MKPKNQTTFSQLLNEMAIEQMSDAELLSYADKLLKKYHNNTTTAPVKPTTKPGTDKPVKNPSPFSPRPGKTPQVNPKPKNLSVDEEEENVAGNDELKSTVMRILQRNKGSY